MSFERLISISNEEQSGLAVRITVIVFWGMFCIGLLAAFFLLHDLEQGIRQRHEAAADHVAHEVRSLLMDHAFVPAQFRIALEHEVTDLGVRGLAADIGAEHLAFGETAGALTLLERRVEYRGSDRNWHAAEVRVYLPAISDVVTTKRKEILVSLGVALLAFGLALRTVLHRVITRPFERMIRSAREFTAGDFRQRFDEQRSDEFGFLAGFINRALDHAMHQQRELRGALDRAQASETALFAEKERAEVTLHSIGDAVITTDADGRIDYLNPVARQLTGWDPAAVRGQPLGGLLRLVDEGSRAPLANPVETCLRDGALTGTTEHVVLLRDDGQEVDVSHSAAPIRDRHGRIVGAVLVFHDVGQARRLARQLSYQATHDALTGLLNRSEFERRLQEAIDSASHDVRGHAMCYLDMDQFKVVNDTCGHVAGDELLRRFGNLLRQHVRDSDVVARLGGDEFGLLLLHCDAEHAARSMQQLLTRIRELGFSWQEQRFDIGASIGLVAIPPGQHNLSEIMAAADVACYAAKDAGRNRLHIYRPDDDELRQRHSDMQWVSRLTRAIAEDRLRLYCQPIVPVTDNGKVPAHYEILVRLLDESGQLVPPGHFIPAAERYHLMPQLDRWVMRATFDFLRTASPARDSRVTINLSGQSLCDDEFLDFTTEQLAASGIAPARICFEITETAAIAHLDRAIRFIATLRATGCEFALDDFGSGLSSFAYLKNLKVDYLKIDGGFVKGMAQDTTDRAMVAAIHGVGQAMGIRTIAEFVENEAILAALKHVGVHFAQGYGIARPAPIEEYLAAGVTRRAAG